MKKETKTALLEDIKTRDNLESLFSQDSWKVVEKFFTDQYNLAIQRLKTAKDPVKDQAIIAVIDSLMENLGATLQIGNQAEVMFKQLKKKENDYV